MRFVDHQTEASDTEAMLLLSALEQARPSDRLLFFKQMRMGRRRDQPLERSSLELALQLTSHFDLLERAAIALWMQMMMR